MKKFVIDIHWLDVKFEVRGEWENTLGDPTGQTGCCEIESLTVLEPNEDGREIRTKLPPCLTDALAYEGLDNIVFQKLMHP